MVFDLDYKEAILAHEKADVLAPSFHSRSSKATAHAVYALEQPVLRHNSSNDSHSDYFQSSNKLTVRRWVQMLDTVVRS